MTSNMIKCKGIDCPIKDKCHRYTTLDKLKDSWFESPFIMTGNVFTCDMFWGDDSQRQFEQLESIMRGDEK